MLKQIATRISDSNLILACMLSFGFILLGSFEHFYSQDTIHVSWFNKDEKTLQVSFSGSIEQSIVHLELQDNQGKLIYYSDQFELIYSPNFALVPLDINLPSGTYLALIRTETVKITSEFQLP